MYRFLCGTIQREDQALILHEAGLNNLPFDAIRRFSPVDPNCGYNEALWLSDDPMCKLFHHMVQEPTKLALDSFFFSQKMSEGYGSIAREALHTAGRKVCRISCLTASVVSNLYWI